jgi:hypothetical protein
MIISYNEIRLYVFGKRKESEEETNERAYQSTILWNRHILKKLKTLVHEIYFTSTLSNNAATWTLTKQNRKKTLKSDMKSLTNIKEEKNG